MAMSICICQHWHSEHGLHGSAACVGLIWGKPNSRTCGCEAFVDAQELDAGKWFGPDVAAAVR